MKLLSFAIFTLCVIGQLNAQTDLTPERFNFSPGATYSADLPAPEAFLGYELGERFTVYEKSVQYFKTLAELSDRIDINQYGETYEGRPLINLVITHPDNHNRLADLQARHLQLTNPQLDKNAQEDILKNDPVFTSMSYNIHGNEASSTEAAMQVAYHLAAATDAETERLLRQSVIILYICINPDGRDRYVYWANSVARNLAATSPNDLEHYEPWPNGRTNHYWFDLNRDWIWGVHPETRGLAVEYQKWMPQVHVDYHEQGYNANYFTAPGTTPRNLLLPNSYEAWSDTFGRANIAAFDEHSISYFTRDRFDFFYPGYGSSYPSVMGAIGMLTEQGGIGAHRAVATDDDYVLTFRQRIFDHYITSLATLHKAAEQREALLRYSVAAWNPANSKEPTQTYVLRNENGGFLPDVLQILSRHGIAVHQAGTNFNLNQTLDYRTGKTAAQSFKAGDYLIFADQSNHLLIHSILARRLTLEDSVMYDMATWSMPLAYNLEAFSSPEKPRVASTRCPSDVGALKGFLNRDQLGNAQTYAFILDWNQRNAPQALSKLWEAGYRVRAAVEPFANSTKAYSAGTLIVLRERNLDHDSGMMADMQRIAESCRVTIDALPSGRMLNGYDLGSDRNRPVHPTRIAMLVEPPFDTYTAGQVYFLFDQETRYPIDRIRLSAFAQNSITKFGERYGYANINDYDVLILPGGGRDLDRIFWQESRNEINQWINRGGVIIALESAAQFFTTAYKYTRVETVKMPSDTSYDAKTIPYSQREDARGLQGIPGTAFNALIDVTNPLAFGVKPNLYTLKTGTLALQPSMDWETVGRYVPQVNDLLVAGYASADNKKELAGQAFAGVARIGDGKIVFLVDNPHFRMFWRGASRMMQNAAMILPGF